VIDVLVVDDHPVVRAGLVALVGAAPDLRVAGEATDGAQAVRLAVELRPDVVLMDLSMPVLDGVGATERILGERPECAVVVLTSFADQSRVADALGAGAVGYLLKDSDPRDLLAAIRSAAEGNAPLDPRVARGLLPRPGANEQPKAGEGLSTREREVLQLVAQGLANKQVGRALGISERTVKAHLGRVFRVIGVADRTSAALWARENLPQEDATR
jgi:DNA-binding NarL/FixJ family response regulator